MKLFDQTFGALEKVMDLNIKRHALLSSNVANSETPGYKAKDLDFAHELEKATDSYQSPLLKTDARHQDVESSSMAHTVQDNTGAVGADGNNVDLDLQMGRIADAARSYSRAANVWSFRLKILRQAINGRGV